MMDDSNFFCSAVHSAHSVCAKDADFRHEWLKSAPALTSHNELAVRAQIKALPTHPPTDGSLLSAEFANFNYRWHSQCAALVPQ